jgi:hypothetical protein
MRLINAGEGGSAILRFYLPIFKRFFTNWSTSLENFGEIFNQGLFIRDYGAMLLQFPGVPCFAVLRGSFLRAFVPYALRNAKGGTPPRRGTFCMTHVFHPDSPKYAFFPLYILPKYDKIMIL